MRARATTAKGAPHGGDPATKGANTIERAPGSGQGRRRRDARRRAGSAGRPRRPAGGPAGRGRGAPPAVVGERLQRERGRARERARVGPGGPAPIDEAARRSRALGRAPPRPPRPAASPARRPAPGAARDAPTARVPRDGSPPRARFFAGIERAPSAAARRAAERADPPESRANPGIRGGAARRAPARASAARARRVPRHCNAPPQCVCPAKRRGAEAARRRRGSHVWKKRSWSRD